MKKFLLFVVVLLFACGKQLESPSADWLGLWSGNKDGIIYFINIKEKKGESSYEEVGKDIIYGNVKIDSENNILTLKNLSFNIYTYPYLNIILNKEQMMLDSILYTKN